LFVCTIWNAQLENPNCIIEKVLTVAYARTL
jgi:hypothetical protein